MNLIINKGTKYREILNDLDFELALSSQRLAVGVGSGSIVSNNDVRSCGWNENLFRAVYRNDPDFADSNFQLFIELGPTEEADTNSSES